MKDASEVFPCSLSRQTYDAFMSVTYFELLDLAIQQLSEAKARGVRHVSVSPESAAWLAKPAARSKSRNSPVQNIPTAGNPVRQSPATLAPSAFSDAASSVSPTLADEKASAMAQLRERVLPCQKCPHLVRSRKNVVFGVGNIHAELMFVGEAPGADEDVQGEPFVGAAGQLLTRIIGTMGFSRETVYIANILKCRPDTPGQSFGNRKPTPEEMNTCLPYLLAQIELIQPKVIVALGGTAVEGMLGNGVGITKLRGRFQEFRGTPLMPTYHPSYLLRNQALSVKREVWEDMLQVLEKLGRPITAKQRGYFLKAS